MFAKILDFLSFSQWIKLIGIIISAITIFGVSKDGLPFVMEKMGVFTKPVTPVVPPITTSLVTGTDSLPNITLPPLPVGSVNVHRKVKVKVEYEITEDSHASVKSIQEPITTASAGGSSSKVMLAMLMSPTPMRFMSSEKHVAIRTLTPEENSYIKISSLWDIYCTDPDFSTQCKVNNNHD
jgi:hypothetical protein